MYFASAFVHDVTFIKGLFRTFVPRSCGQGKDRCRNDTVKDRREDELPFIPGQAPAAEGGVAVNLKAPQTPRSKPSSR